jgi:osmotically-inducible protein OsmY
VAISDREIRAGVQAALAAEPALSQAKITVTVEDGVVTLGGHVPDEEHKALARACARRVAGVEEVEVALRVGSAQRGAGRMWDAVTGHDYQEASRRIEDELDE